MLSIDHNARAPIDYNRQMYSAPVMDEVEDRSVLGAAFRMENDVANAMMLLNRGNFAPEPGFDYRARAQESFLFQNYPDNFVGVQSSAEWNSIEQRILQEQKDRAVIEAAGWSGIGAELLAGVASPTVLFPAGLGSRAPTIGRAVRSAAGWALVGVGAQEMVLQSQQELRTGTESALSIGAGMVMAGVLGGALRGATGEIAAKIEADMDAPIPGQSIHADLNGGGGPGNVAGATPDDEQVRLLAEQLRAEGMTEAESLSAAAVLKDEYQVFEDPGKLAPGATAFAWLGPVTRGSMSSYPARRAVMSQLSSGGLAREGNMDWQATAPGGDIETRKMGWQANLASSIGANRQFFYDWYARTGRGGKLRGFFAVSEMEKFNTEVGRAMELEVFGQQHPVPEIRQAAQHYMSTVFGPMTQRAREIGMPAFKDIEPDLAMKMATQKIQVDMLFRDRDALTTIVRDNAHWQLRNNPDLLQNAKVRKWLGVDEAEIDETVSNIINMTEYADAVAHKIIAKWEGSFNKHGTITTRNEIPVPPQFVYFDPNRTWSNGRSLGEFLERNIEKVARSYVRTLAGDIELFDRFGTVMPEMREHPARAPFWSDIEKEFDAKLKEINDDAKLTEEQKQKARFKTTQELKAFERDFEVVVSRLRNARGQPDDPRAFAFRAGRAIINLNTVRMMGMVTISSLPDMGRLVMKHGMMTAWRDAFMPLFTNMRQIKMAMKEAELSGASLDVVLHGRTNAIADLWEEAEYGSAMERGLQTATNYIGTVGLFDYYNQFMKGLSSSLTMADMSRAMQRTVEGTETAYDKKLLAGNGIHKGMAKQIWKKMTTDGGTEVRPGVWFPNTEDWGKVDGQDIYDYEKMAYREGLTEAQISKAKAEIELGRTFHAALARNIVDTIITPGVERPNMVDGGIASRILFQFRSFGLSSTFKTVAAASQDARMGNFGPVLSGMSFSLALGAVSYYLWGMAFGPDSKQAKQVSKLFDEAGAGDSDAMARIADEAIARSGLLGVLEEVRRVAERIPATRNLATLADQQTTRSPFERPITEMAGPTAGLLEQFDKIATTIDEPRGSTFDAFQRLVPYQNVFWLRWGIDQMFEGAKEAAGVK